MTAAVIVCLVSTQGNGTLFASDDEHTAGTIVSSTELPRVERFRFTLDPGFFDTNPSSEPFAQGARTFKFVPTPSSAFARQVYQGRPYRMRGRDGSIKALMIGAVATITGTAILVYANRPDCDGNRSAGGCGYGTKVIGGSVLAGGIVGLTVGAITW
jgi:hypothetical protein